MRAGGRPRPPLLRDARRRVEQGPGSALGDGAQREQRLAVLDGLRAFRELPHNFAGLIRLDLVHQLHGFHDAEHLPALLHVSGRHEGGRIRRRSGVKGADDGRLHEVQVFGRFRRGSALCRRRWGCSSRSGVCQEILARGRRRSSQTGLQPAGRSLALAPQPHAQVVALVLQLLETVLDHEAENAGDLTEVCARRRAARNIFAGVLLLRHRIPEGRRAGAAPGPQSSISSRGADVSVSLPPSSTSTSSSIRIPPRPGRYTPGSMVTTLPAFSSAFWLLPREGRSCTSSPKPCPVLWMKYCSKSWPRSTLRAASSTWEASTPARTAWRAAVCAARTPWYQRRTSPDARPTCTVRVRSEQ